MLSQCNDSICTHSLPLSLSPSLPLSLLPVPGNHFQGSSKNPSEDDGIGDNGTRRGFSVTWLGILLGSGRESVDDAGESSGAGSVLEGADRRGISPNDPGAMLAMGC